MVHHRLPLVHCGGKIQSERTGHPGGDASGAHLVGILGHGVGQKMIFKYSEGLGPLSGHKVKWILLVLKCHGGLVYRYISLVLIPKVLSQQDDAGLYPFRKVGLDPELKGPHGKVRGVVGFLIIQVALFGPGVIALEGAIDMYPFSPCPGIGNSRVFVRMHGKGRSRIYQ